MCWNSPLPACSSVASTPHTAATLPLTLVHPHYVPPFGLQVGRHIQNIGARSWLQNKTEVSSEARDARDAECYGRNDDCHNSNNYRYDGVLRKTSFVVFRVVFWLLRLNCTG